MRLVLALLCAALACAGESPAVAAFKLAMAGDDGAAKRDATKALAAASAGTDAEIMPMLIQAVGDRQASQWAIESLQKRTGLVKPGRGRGGSGYPGYPQTDDATGWGAWFAAWGKDQEAKAKLDNLAPKPAPTTPTPPADGAAAPADGTETPAAAAPEAAPRIPTEDLGKLDRIVYKSGRSLTAFVRSKRLDGDGNLVSIRVVHHDGVGEEVIGAATIARIEEDIE